MATEITAAQNKHQWILLNKPANLCTKVKSPYLSLILDLSKAIDSVNHDLLLHKLVQLNRDSTWIESYLNERAHSVKINKITFQPCSNIFGVPQGSIFGPILLNIFRNDNIKLNSLPRIKTSTAMHRRRRSTPVQWLT